MSMTINTSVHHIKKKSYKLRFLFILLIPVTLLIRWLVSLSPTGTEKYFSRGIYKYIMQPVSQLTGLFPFSLAEIVLLFLAIYLPLRLILLIVKAIRQKKISVFVPFLANIVMIGSLWYFIQNTVWNLNYERLSFAQNAGIKTQPSSVSQLEGLCALLINQTNNLRKEVTEDKNGVMTVPGRFSSISKRSLEGYIVLEKQYTFLGGRYGHPKPVLFSRFMSHTNIIGIYACLSGEANIDTDIPDMELASTTLHEMAHQRGFAREDEANYISYLACMAHPDPDFKYSGSVMALQYSMNALYSADKNRYFKLAKTYSEAYLRDLKAEQAYWKQFQGATKKIADKMNDTYLKLNGETDGVQSYGRMVDLLLAQYHDRLANNP
ncbi:MAG: DUF3810 domain-containing protein [Clostridia bacterium]|nr:DUF3810 domain-containing protein [Clostridia bacterium]